MGAGYLVSFDKTGANLFSEDTYHSLDLTSIRVHAASCLTRLDVSPDHGHHIPLVIHETRVKVRRLVRVGALDVRGATRERVLEEVEHGEELAGGHEHVVAEPAADDAVVHDGLVGLLLKVRLPAVLEVRRGPPLKVLELLGRGPDLDARLDAVRGQGTGAPEVPLLIYLCARYR